ncbi:mechanosensitive ion channel domain-containing protein [Actinoplanes sp. NPDC000266]
MINLWRPDFRRTLAYGFAALAALVTGSQFGTATTRDRLITYGCALLVAVFGVTATRTAAREVHRIAVARASEAAATPLRVMVELTGYLIAAVSVCDLLEVGLERLLVAGSVTGIVLGLAAQPVLGNLFAGLVILFARPYVPGTRVRVMSGALNGPHVGTIVSAGLLYTVLETDEGPLNIPNSALMASAVGPTTADVDVPAEPR